MFCPEDGTYLPYNRDQDDEGMVHYGPCPRCGVVWVYDANQGVYLPWQHQHLSGTDPLADAAAVPEGIRRERCHVDVDTLVARILDTLEAQANALGQAQYLLQAQEELVVEYRPHVKVFPEIHPYGELHYIYCFDGDKREISRIEAIRLLLESRASQGAKS